MITKCINLQGFNCNNSGEHCSSEELTKPQFQFQRGYLGDCYVGPRIFSFVLVVYGFYTESTNHYNHDGDVYESSSLFFFFIKEDPHPFCIVQILCSSFPDENPVKCFPTYGPQFSREIETTCQPTLTGIGQ